MCVCHWSVCKYRGIPCLCALPTHINDLHAHHQLLTNQHPYPHPLTHTHPPIRPLLTSCPQVDWSPCGLWQAQVIRYSTTADLNTSARIGKWESGGLSLTCHLPTYLCFILFKLCPTQTDVFSSPTSPFSFLSTADSISHYVPDCGLCIYIDTDAGIRRYSELYCWTH